MEDENTEDVKPDEDVAPDTVKIWAVVAFLLSLPVAIVVGHHLDPGRGRAAGVALGLMLLSVRAFWYLKRYASFWMSIAALIIIHVVLIVLVPWTNKSFPAPELWPIGIADFAAMCGFIKLVEKAMSRGDAAAPRKSARVGPNNDRSGCE